MGPDEEPKPSRARSAAPAEPASRLVQAVRVETLSAASGAFSYAVHPGERRGGTRRRTRLRSGKLIRKDGQFLCECLVNNLSASGCRLRLPSVTPDLQPSLYFYDDQSEQLFQARTIWKSERDLGLRLMPCLPNALHRSIAGAMRRKFYALRR